MNLVDPSTTDAPAGLPEIPPPPQPSAEVTQDQSTDHLGQPPTAAPSECAVTAAASLEHGEVFDDYEAFQPQPRRTRRQVELLSLTTCGMSSSEILPGSTDDVHQPSVETASIEEIDHASTSSSLPLPPLPIPFSGAFVPRVTDSSAGHSVGDDDDEDELIDDGKNKGKGKNRPRVRASEAVKPKTYIGVLTRRQEKLMRDQEERLQGSMSKLVTTGKKIIQRDISLEDWSEPADISNPLSDFSSHDLIRNRIAEPQNFDEPIVSNLPNNEINVLSNVPPSTVAEPSSIWNLSLNPFAYYRRNQNESGRVDSIPDDANIQPQQSSTPNQSQNRDDS